MEHENLMNYRLYTQLLAGNGSPTAQSLECLLYILDYQPDKVPFVGSRNLGVLVCVLGFKVLNPCLFKKKKVLNPC